jgi:hypothetical protein
MTERALEEYKLATMRHILLKTEELKGEDGKVLKDEDGNPLKNSVQRKKDAEKLLNQWKADGGTVDVVVTVTVLKVPTAATAATFGIELTANSVDPT